MERYVVLMKFTDRGIKDIKNGPKRVELASKALEAVGGKLVDFYLVMGEYDYVVIGDVPNAEVGTAFLLSLGAAGNARTTSLRAFNIKEYTDIVKNIP
jgi:uncharacterized protein with GYD domain